MKIGSLNQRIRIEEPTVTQDTDYGSASVSWSTLATVWANVQEVLPSRSERVSQDLRIADRPARVRIRYRTDITSDMRIVLTDRSNRVMKIATPPVEIGRKNGIEFMAVDFSTSGTAA